MQRKSTRQGIFSSSNNMNKMNKYAMKMWGRVGKHWPGKTKEWSIWVILAVVNQLCLLVMSADIGKPTSKNCSVREFQRTGSKWKVHVTSRYFNFKWTWTMLPSWWEFLWPICDELSILQQWLSQQCNDVITSQQMHKKQKHVLCSNW